jgi:hypothetical protein
VGRDELIRWASLLDNAQHEAIKGAAREPVPLRDHGMKAALRAYDMIAIVRSQVVGAIGGES